MRSIKRWGIVAALVVIVVAGCNANENGGDEELPEARPLLEEVAAKVQSADSFALEIDVRGYPVVIQVQDFPLPQNLPLIFQYAKGWFVAPDRLQANVQVSLGELATTVDLIAIGEDQYMQSDVLTNGKWFEQEIIIGFTPESLMADDGGIAHALDSIQNLEMVGREDLDGLDVYHLRGTIAAQELYSLTFALISTKEGQIDVDVYVMADEREVEQILLTEPLPDGVEDEDPTTWVISLQDYNEPVEIDVPTLSES